MERTSKGFDEAFGIFIRLTAVVAISQLVCAYPVTAGAMTYRIYDARGHLVSSASAQTLAQAETRVKSFSPVLSSLDKETVSRAASQTTYRYRPVSQNILGYHSDRFWSFSDPVAACRQEVYVPGYPDGNYAGIGPHPDRPDCAECFACYCHSNPGAVCGLVLPQCPYDHNDPKLTTYPFYYSYDSTLNVCTSSAYAIVDADSVEPEKNVGEPLICVVNPVHPLTGNKFQAETDYQGTSAGWLSFVRYYNSDPGAVPQHAYTPLGPHWLSTYSQRLVHRQIDGAPYVLAHRPDGKTYYFKDLNGDYLSDPDVTSRLLPRHDGRGSFVGWRYINSRDNVETYDTTGRLTTISDRAGRAQTLEYALSTADGGDDNPETLDRVTGPFGRTLSFAYDTSGRLETLIDPGGGVYTYGYDAIGNLVSVSFPDDTPQNKTDDPTRTYRYEDPNFPAALTGIIDENGDRFASYGYDAQGRAVLSEHAGGAGRATLTYHANNTTTVTDGLGQASTFDFTVAQRVAKPASVNQPCASCNAPASSYTYDSQGFPASRTDFNGNLTTYVHNDRGLEISRTAAAGTPEARTITTEWHAEFHLPRRITEPGKTTEFDYNDQGLLTTRIETDTATDATRTWRRTYTPEGLLETVDGPRTDVDDLSRYAYDVQGNLTHIINALNHVTQVTAHDDHGRPLTLIDPNHLITELVYDARGRLRSRDMGGALTTFAYDTVGNLQRITLPDERYLDYAYDAAHRLVSVTDALGNRIDYTLDAFGNRTHEDVSDGNGALTRTRRRVYNRLNRLTEDIGGERQSTGYDYDAGGLLRNIDGPRTDVSDVTAYTYDTLNRLIEVIDPLEGSTRYGYDGQDNVVTVTDARDNTTTYTYDGLGNLTAQVSPDTGTTAYDYDAAGNRLSQTNARGITVTYRYDALNRLTAIQYPDPAQNISLTYDQNALGIGRLARITDTAGTTDYLYDARGNLLAETRLQDSVAYVTQYAYDDADNPTRITYPSGRVVTYRRDAAGRIVEVATDGQTSMLASDIQYLPFGPMSALTFGNGLTMNRTFDADYRLIAQSTGNIQQLVLGVDPAGNITDITDSINTTRSQSFSYDALNRLVSATGIYGPRGYAYDALGNRIALTRDNVTDTYSIDPASNRLLAIAGAVTKTFRYDEVGNTLTDGTTSYGYDQANRLTEVSVNGSPTAYTVSAAGKRVKKTGPSGATLYHYDARGHLVAETNTGGNTLREYVYLGDLRLAIISGEQPTPADIVLDNAEGSVYGHWPASTVVAGYYADDYQYHMANSTPPGGIIVDNADAGFSMTGAWPISAVVNGYYGTNYQYHAANGAPPSGRVVDDLDSDANASGSWRTSSSISGYLGTGYRYHAAGTGAHTFTWRPSVPAAGSYQVYARWTSHANRATNATYTIRHRTGDTPVTVNQRHNGGNWHSLGTYAFAAGTASITLSDAADGYVIADAVKLVPEHASPNTATWEPNITVPGPYKVYARWTAHSNRASNATYTVHHAGSATTPVTVNQQQHGGQWRLLGSYEFIPGANHRIDLTDQANGYVIADAIKLVAADAAPNSLTWTLPIAQSGEYAVYARWTAHPNRATDAPFTIHHANGTDTVTVNQQRNGGQWRLLGSYDFDAGGYHTIQLTDQANGYVIADALKLVAIGTNAAPPSIYYVHTDHLGTPQRITNARQSTVWHADYQPFGKANITTAVIDNPLRFPGQYFDPESGLHYNYFRDYDPNTGRYIQSDPIGLWGGLNTYAYANANPLRHVDRTGLFSCPGGVWTVWGFPSVSLFFGGWRNLK